MSTKKIEVKYETLQRLKVLGAQIDESIDNTLEYLLDSYDGIREYCFQIAIEQAARGKSDSYKGATLLQNGRNRIFTNIC